MSFWSQEVTCGHRGPRWSQLVTGGQGQSHRSYMVKFCHSGLMWSYIVTICNRQLHRGNVVPQGHRRSQAVTQLWYGHWPLVRPMVTGHWSDHWSLAIGHRSSQVVTEVLYKQNWSQEVTGSHRGLKGQRRSKSPMWSNLIKGCHILSQSSNVVTTGHMRSHSVTED